MRSFILHTITLSLGLAACGDDKDLTSTSLTTTGTTTASSTTDTSGADEPTTGSSTTEPGSTTTDPGGTMPEPGSTTIVPDSTTIEPDSTNTTFVPDSTTIEPDTTTDGGTEVPYVDCSNDPMNPIPCPDELQCIDGFNTNGAVFGSVCSPACAEDKFCPTPDGADGISAVCLFGMGMPTNCVLACSLGDDTCPGGLTCEDVGLSDGICTHA